MRAPATSPIPAPVSAPQTAKGNEASDASPFAALMDAVNAGSDVRTDIKAAAKPSKVEGKPENKLGAASPQDAANDGAAPDTTAMIAPPDGITTDVRADALLLMPLQGANTQPPPLGAGSGPAETATDLSDTTDDAATPVHVQQVEVQQVEVQQVEIAADLLSQGAMVQPAAAPPPPANSNLPNIDPALAETVAPQAPEAEGQPPVAQASQADAPQPPAPKPGKKTEAKAATVNSDQPVAEQRSQIVDSAKDIPPTQASAQASAQTLVAMQAPAPQSATSAPATPQPRAQNDVPSATGPGAGPDTVSDTGMRASAPDGTPQKPDVAQNSDAKPNAAKDGASTASADAKSDAIAASQAALDAPKPQINAQAPAANTNFVQHLAAAVEADAPVQASAPGITQHVSVSSNAQATPDMPGLAINIRARSQSGAKQFDIRLDPPELGRVEVRLSIDHAGKTSAHLTAEQPQTLDLLQKDSAVLARALRDAGLNVSQDGLNFSLRQDWHGGSQSNFAQDMGDRDGARGQRGTTLNASKSIEATATSAAYRAPADGRLDIRV